MTLHVRENCLCTTCSSFTPSVARGYIQIQHGGGVLCPSQQVHNIYHDVPVLDVSWRISLFCRRYFERIIMVKTEEAPSAADGWKEVFGRNRSVPPPSQTVRLAADHHLTQSRGFQLCLSRILAPHLPQVISPIHPVDVVPVLALTLTWLWCYRINEGPFIEHGIKKKKKKEEAEENVANTDSQSFIIQGELEFCTCCQAVCFCKFSLEIIHQTPP